MKTANVLMLLWFAIALALGQSGLAGREGKKESIRLAEPHYHAQLAPLLQGGSKRWDKSYLIAYGFDGTFSATPSKPAVLAYDQNGQVNREAIVWLNDAQAVSIGDAAVTKNGSLVLTASALNKEGVISDFIASVGNDGHLSRVVRTSPFLPVYICSCDDENTAWIYGMERSEPEKGYADSLRLRHYSFEKGEITAMLNIAGGTTGWTLSRGRYEGEINLRCNSKSVVLYNGATGDFYEYSIASNTLRTTKVAPLPAPSKVRLTGFALTESGDVFASMRYKSKQPPMGGLYKLGLDGKGGGFWAPVPGTVGPYLKDGTIERLLGTNGTELVHTRKLDGEAHWSKVERHSLPAQ